jgi:biopolymer transport protein ExbD/biopolymer transport protein TolR
MWAFLSVEIVLLIILMLHGPSPHAHRSSLDLPFAEHPTLMPGALREDSMLVAVTRDGQCFFRNSDTPPDKLAALLRNSMAQGSEAKVYLRVDTRARYSDAAAVIERIREAGIQNIGVITEKREPH